VSRETSRAAGVPSLRHPAIRSIAPSGNPARTTGQTPTHC
jgi:hypothetical protein